MLMFFRGLLVIFFFAGLSHKALSERAEPSSNTSDGAESRQSIHMSYGAIKHKSNINKAYFNGERSKGSRIEVSWLYKFFLQKKFEQSLALGLDFVKMGVEESYQDSSLSYTRRFSSFKLGWNMTSPNFYGFNFSIQPGAYLTLQDSRKLKSKLGTIDVKYIEEDKTDNLYLVLGIGYRLNEECNISIEHFQDWDLYNSIGWAIALGFSYELY